MVSPGGRETLPDVIDIADMPEIMTTPNQYKTILFKLLVLSLCYVKCQSALTEE